MIEAFRSFREEGYGALIEAAGRVRRKAALGAEGAALKEELKKTEREFRAERRRDYSRSPLRKEAADALRAARHALFEDAGDDPVAGEGG